MKPNRRVVYIKHRGIFFLVLFSIDGCSFLNNRMGNTDTKMETNKEFDWKMMINDANLSMTNFIIIFIQLNGFGDFCCSNFCIDKTFWQYGWCQNGVSNLLMVFFSCFQFLGNSNLIFQYFVVWIMFMWIFFCLGGQILN